MFLAGGTCVAQLVKPSDQVMIPGSQDGALRHWAPCSAVSLLLHLPLPPVPPVCALSLSLPLFHSPLSLSFTHSLSQINKIILRHKKRKIVKLWEIYMNIIQRFNMVQMNVYYLYQKLFFLLLQEMLFKVAVFQIYLCSLENIHLSYILLGYLIQTLHKRL